jgi:hypothetical protein
MSTVAQRCSSGGFVVDLVRGQVASSAKPSRPSREIGALMRDVSIVGKLVK